MEASRLEYTTADVMITGATVGAAVVGAPVGDPVAVGDPVGDPVVGVPVVGVPVGDPVGDFVGGVGVPVVGVPVGDVVPVGLPVGLPVGDPVVVTAGHVLACAALPPHVFVAHSLVVQVVVHPTAPQSQPKLAQAQAAVFCPKPVAVSAPAVVATPELETVEAEKEAVVPGLVFPEKSSQEGTVVKPKPEQVTPVGQQPL